MTLLHVPVIDLSPYWEGTEEGKKRVAAQVDQAYRDIGSWWFPATACPRS